MQEIILKWIEQNYPELIGFIFVAWVTWRTARLYVRLEKVEDKCKEFDSTNSAIQLIKAEISKISANMDKLFLFLNQTNDKFPKDFFTSKSPIQLSELGMELLEKFGGKKFIDENNFTLINSLHENNTFNSALDVQDRALSLLYTYSDKEGLVPIKNWVYNNPIYRVGEENELTFTLATAMSIMAIYLRDKYFEKYPELKDMDKLESATN